MALQRNREEVVNTQLAILISGLGVTADAETIHVHGKYRPDVLFELRGHVSSSKESLRITPTQSKSSWMMLVSACAAA